MDEQDNRPGDFALDEPLPLGVTEPVDVVQVRADDALIAALNAAEDLHIDDPIDERLAELLHSWREDVHAEPQRPLVDLAAATAALATAPRTARRRQNPFGPLATAAAVLVIAFIGLGLAARGAEPGDPLWNVTKVLYSDKAKSVEAKVTVSKKLEEAQQALQSGNVPAAMIALQEARQKLTVVAAEDGKQELATRTEQLMSEVNTSTATTPTSPPTVTSTTPTATTTPDTSTSPSTTTNPPPTTTNPTTTTEVPPTSSEVPGSVVPGATAPEGSPKAGGDPSAGTEPPPASATS